MNVEQFANSDEVVSQFLDNTGSTLYANEENPGEGSQGNLGRGQHNLQPTIDFGGKSP
jgi:hypothetical protein